MVIQPMSVETSSFGAIDYICHNLRAQDHEEVFGILMEDGADYLTQQVTYAAWRGFILTASWQGKPAGLVGFTIRHPELAEVFAMGTDDFEHVAFRLTYFGLKYLKPMMLEQGIRRAQCQSLMSHHTAHRWLERLGFRREAVLREYGRGARDYYQYVALASELPTTNRE